MIFHILYGVPSKKDLKLNLFWNKHFQSVEIHATAIPSQGYDCENLTNVRRNDSKHPESV